MKYFAFHAEGKKFKCSLSQVVPIKPLNVKRNSSHIKPYRMSRWQSVCGSVVFVDLELLSPVHAFQSLEALQGNLRRSGDELKELGLVSLVE